MFYALSNGTYLGVLSSKSRARYGALVRRDFAGYRVLARLLDRRGSPKRAGRPLRQDRSGHQSRGYEALTDWP